MDQRFVGGNHVSIHPPSHWGRDSGISSLGTMGTSDGSSAHEMMKPVGITHVEMWEKKAHVFHIDMIH